MVSFTLGCVELTATLFEQDASSSSADASGDLSDAQQSLLHLCDRMSALVGRLLSAELDLAVQASLVLLRHA